MTTRKSAKKAPAKKTAAKKTAAKKTAAKKTAAKKTAATKKTAKATKKTTGKSSKAAAKKVAEGRAQAKESKTKIKASDLITRPVHTPAVFKPSNQRPSVILFTLEEVREVLKKRAEEGRATETESSVVPAPENAPAVKQTPAMETPAPEAGSGKHAAASLDDILGLTPSPAKAGTDYRRGDPVPKEFERYHALLLELRREVGDEVSLHSNDTLKRSQKEDAGDLSISVDAGTDNFDRDFALSLLSSEQEALSEIEAAIERIYDGSYGVCEITGEKIDAERLEAVPFTRFSLEGQQQWEASGGRKKVNRQGTMLNDGTGETISFGDDDAES